MTTDLYQVSFAADAKLDFQPIAFYLKIQNAADVRRLDSDLLEKRRLVFTPRGENSRLAATLNKLMGENAIVEVGYIQVERIVNGRVVEHIRTAIQHYSVTNDAAPMFTVLFDSTDRDPADSELKHDNYGHWTGPHKKLIAMRDAQIVLGRLDKAQIPLRDFKFIVTDVFSRQEFARPYGFSFKCPDSKKLLDRMIALSKRKTTLPAAYNDYSKPSVTEPTFSEDSGDTIEGKISGGVTEGRGFRQIGNVDVLHVEIDAQTNKCDVHIDSHGYVTGSGQYNWSRGLLHGFWDLGAHYAPGFYKPIGDQGRLGPLARPVRDPNGNTRWIFGVWGEW